jgi:hypothetical protein
MELPSRSTMRHEATHTEIYIPMQQRDKNHQKMYHKAFIDSTFRARARVHVLIHTLNSIRIFIDSYVVKLILLIHMETPYNMIKVLPVIPVSRSLIQRCYKLIAGNSSRMALGFGSIRLRSR